MRWIQHAPVMIFSAVLYRYDTVLVQERTSMVAQYVHEGEE